MENILPDAESYQERVSILMIPSRMFLVKICIDITLLKVALDEHHQLHTLKPEKQSMHRCHSARLKESFLVCTRTDK